MCIAILNYSEELSKKTLKTCWDNNGDGGGILYTEGGKLKVFKTLLSFDDFYNEYISIRSRTDDAVVLHFRIMTHGERNLDNCHPFLVNETLGFVHNGIIDIDTSSAEHFSDTWHFNEKVLKNVNVFNQEVKEMIELYISYSKLIFLNAEGSWDIFNEDLGVWDGDCWFSNTTYKESDYYDFGGIKKYKTEHEEIIEDDFASDELPCNTCNNWDCDNCEVAKYFGTVYSNK